MNRFVNRLKTDFTKIIERLPFELQRQKKRVKTCSVKSDKSCRPIGSWLTDEFARFVTETLDKRVGQLVYHFFSSNPPRRKSIIR